MTSGFSPGCIRAEYTQANGSRPTGIRTFFVTAATWGRRSIFRAEPMAHLFLNTATLLAHKTNSNCTNSSSCQTTSISCLTPAPDIPLEKAVQLIKGGFSFRVKKELGSNTEIWGTGFTEHRIKDAGRLPTPCHLCPRKSGACEVGRNSSGLPLRFRVRQTWDLDLTPPWLKP